MGRLSFHPDDVAVARIRSAGKPERIPGFATRPLDPRPNRDVSAKGGIEGTVDLLRHRLLSVELQCGKCASTEPMGIDASRGIAICGSCGDSRPA